MSEITTAPTSTRAKILRLIDEARKERKDPQGPGKWIITLRSTIHDYSGCDEVGPEPLETEHLVEVFLPKEDIHAFVYLAESAYDDEDWVFVRCDESFPISRQFEIWQRVEYRLSDKTVLELVAAPAKEQS